MATGLGSQEDFFLQNITITNFNEYKGEETQMVNLYLI